VQETIEHRGILKVIEDKKLQVMILSKSACLSCKVNASCSVSDMKEKIIEVAKTKENFKIGEEVKVFYEKNLGFKALFFSYVLPFFILFMTLIITSFFTKNELITGLFSLGILFPYYFIIYLLKDKFKKTFIFHIKKI